jgi:hypothetical protein
MIYVFDLPEKKLSELISVAEVEKKLINEELAGNIRKQISLDKYTYLLEDFLIEQLKNSRELNDAVQKLNILTNPTSLKLKELWVNYQKKYEFNPFHNHSGIISFIIFGKIPFRMSDEHKVSPGVVAEKNLSGVLQFFYLSTNFKEPIKTREFFIDQSWEGKGLMFFSNLNHLVYPFFSSDDYRITFSGNIFLKHE